MAKQGSQHRPGVAPKKGPVATPVSGRTGSPKRPGKAEHGGSPKQKGEIHQDLVE